MSYFKYVLCICAVFILITLSCAKHEDPTQLTYEEEILRCISDDDDLKEFMTTDLYCDESFQFDNSSKQYFYKIDSVTRHVYPIIFAEEPKNIEPYGIRNKYDARAQILDVFQGNFFSINGIDTTRVSKFVDSLNRFAYFLKLGNNGDKYAGWYFWGFAGGDYDYYADDPDRDFNALASNKTFSARRPNRPIPHPNKGLINMEIDTLHVDTQYVGGEMEITYDIDTTFLTPTLYLINEKTLDTLYYLIMNFNIPKLNSGDSLHYSGKNYDQIFARTSYNSVHLFETAYISGKFVTGWKIPLKGNLYTNLILFDEPGYFKVDTIYVGNGKMYESTLVKNNNYVIPYQIIQ